MKYDWNAFLNKFRAVPLKEKMKLVVKFLLRLFGVKKCMFLGGYRLEEDRRQEELDEAIYRRLKTGSENSKISAAAEDTSIGGEDPLEPNENCTEEIKQLLKEQDAYIALMVESLDAGGLEAVVKLLAEEYHARCLPVRVFCVNSGGRIAEQLQKSGIEVIAFNRKQYVFEDYVKNHRPLLVNTHYVVDWLELLHEMQIPVVEVIHNMYVFQTPDRIEAERRKAQCVDRYIAVSSLAAEIFRKKVPQVSKEKIVVIGNAVSRMHQSQRDRKLTRKELRIPENAFVYLAAGSLDARKNQIGVLRAFSILKRLTQEPVVLVLAGEETDEEYVRKIKRFINERELSDSVILTGHYDRMADLMAASDVFVMDSYYEGWSMAATESLCSGLPLIHSRCGSGVELVDGGRNGILVENPIGDIGDMGKIELYDAMHAGINENVEELTEALYNMWRERENWNNRRKAIICCAKEKFPVSRMILQYLWVYLEVSRGK